MVGFTGCKNLQILFGRLKNAWEDGTHNMLAYRSSSGKFAEVFETTSGIKISGQYRNRKYIISTFEKG